MSTQDTLKVGDVVRLRSGGPLMTVARFTLTYCTDGEVKSEAVCQWFDGARLCSDYFAELALDKVPTDPQPPVQP